MTSTRHQRTRLGGHTQHAFLHCLQVTIESLCWAGSHVSLRPFILLVLMAEEGLLSHTLTGGGVGVGNTEFMLLSISPLDGKHREPAVRDRLLSRLPAHLCPWTAKFERLNDTMCCLCVASPSAAESDLLLVSTLEVSEPDSLSTDRPPETEQGSTCNVQPSRLSKDLYYNTI